MSLVRAIIVTLLATGFSSSVVAKDLPFQKEQYEGAAKKIAVIDSVLNHCSDRLKLNGAKFVELQAVWRLMLLSGSYELSRYYYLQLEENEALFQNLVVQHGESAPALYCAAMDLWSKSNFPDGNPFKDFE